MIAKIPVTCASVKNALMLMMILYVPLMDTQANITVQNFNASLTTKDLAWLTCMTAAVHGRTENGFSD